MTADSTNHYNWYALQTKPKHEKVVATVLEGKGYIQFLPLYQNWRRCAGRLRSVFLPLFPGYLFCRFDTLHRLPILVTPGVFGIVSVGNIPAPIPDEEIVMIQTSCSGRLRVSPWPYLEGGDLVRVECGPLQGVQGVFLNEKRGGRLVLSIEILRRSVAVEMDRNWVRPLQQAV